MGWPLSILVAILAGAEGLVCAGLVMHACVRWYRVSDFEGKAGYAIVTVALLGGASSFVLGLVVSRTADAFLEGLGSACGAVLVLAGLAAGIARALADVPPRIDGRELMLDIELRLPVDAGPVGASDSTELDLHSVVRRVARKTRHGELRTMEARAEGGRWVVPGSVHLFTGRGMRSITLRLDDKPRFGFVVPLPSRPTRRFEAWSDWGPRPRPPNPPWPDTQPSFRFRVRRIEE